MAETSRPPPGRPGKGGGGKAKLRLCSLSQALGPVPARDAGATGVTVVGRPVRAPPRDSLCGPNDPFLPPGSAGASPQPPDRFLNTAGSCTTTTTACSSQGRSGVGFGSRAGSTFAIRRTRTPNLSPDIARCRLGKHSAVSQSISSYFTRMEAFTNEQLEWFDWKQFNGVTMDSAVMANQQKKLFLLARSQALKGPSSPSAEQPGEAPGDANRSEERRVGKEG
eukprot:RCo043604